ncbi:MAG: hypothetical protein AB7N61_27860 [Acidimicrobiia bacterium]
MRVSSLNGRDVPAAVQASLLAALALPAFVVASDGRVSHLPDLDEFIASTRPLMADGQVPANFAAVLEDVVVAKYWGSWAGNWVDLGEIDEARIEYEAPMPAPYENARVNVVVESLEDRSDELAHLRMTQTTEGPDLAIAMGVLGDRLDASLDTLDFEGKRRVVMDVATDPTNLRPVVGSYAIDVELSTGGKTQSHRELRRWTMDWSDCD